MVHAAPGLNITCAITNANGVYCPDDPVPTKIFNTQNLQFVQNFKNNSWRGIKFRGPSL